MAKSRKPSGSNSAQERVEHDAVAELLAAPPEEFTARRNALAKQLTTQGHKDVAAKVRALKKPTRPVWAVNRLAHEAADEIEALLAAATALETAQQRLMSGKADAAALRDASAEHRQRLRSLRARAAKLLDEPASSGSAMLDRVEATLNGAAAGDEGLRQALRAGRITAELSPPTFGPFGGFEGAAPPPQAATGGAPKQKKDTAATRKEAGEREASDDREAREAEARRKAEARAREAAAAKEEAKAAADALDAAERAVVDAQARVHALEAELKHAREAVARSRLEARSAARAAKAAAQRSQRLRS